MTETLQHVFKELGLLPPIEQDRLARMLHDYVEQFADGSRLEEDLKDPEYRATVEDALQKGEADIAAGRVSSIDDVRARSKDRLSKMHE